MLNYDPWPSSHQCLSKPKLCTVYILFLLVSFTIVSAKSRSFNHQIDSRSPEIDPYWYVGRGVRPIGRFGKRQLKFRKTFQPRLRFLLEQTLEIMKKHGVLNIENIHSW
ncbi:prolactin-releasing peptide [Xenopus laevis]|uniref:Prolactin-releasing peptide n=2 Tax=Xenopus laevis TaxID=8355 RepID=A0A974CPF1_XENLA|nr:prolactin-releasing peptide [Xenopus laevis]OCT75971.1 hypothetical protein XELAEV_18031157mg [Xenopus laevis]